MAELPPRSIHSPAGSGPSHTTPQLSNLTNVHPQLHDPRLPPHYPSSWRPRTIEEYNRWSISPQGMFPLTLVGSGQNPDPLPHPQPRHPPNSGTTPAGNLGGQKRTTRLGETSSFGGFGPVPSPREAATETDSQSPPPPPFSSYYRRNGASDVWAFAHPLDSSDKPPVDQWPMSPEPNRTSKPKAPWFGCKLCAKFGCGVSPSIHKMLTLITFQ